MSITVGKYTFDGSYIDTSRLRDNSGIYAIHCNRNGSYYLIDVGESATVKSRIDSHDRADCWERNCTGTLTVSVLYTPNQQQTGRRLIEQELRNQFAPVCGER